MDYPIELKNDDRNKIENDRQTFVGQSQMVQVVGDVVGRGVASDLISQAKRYIAGINTIMDPIVAAAHDTHKKATTARSMLVSPYKSESDRLLKLLNAFDSEQMRIERERQQAEAARARAAIEENRLREAAAIEANAVAAESVGDIESAESLRNAADAIIDKPIAPVAIATPTQTMPKIHGQYSVPVWKFEIENPDAVPREFMTPDLKKIGDYVRYQKESAKIAGVKIWAETENRFRL